ncbi:dTMP kinase [Alkalicaulis satelles]|uniref:Thymidylate kinase n=1 Tax=Alkalicaulis satelles TaxID=2609175 RepID=A0A5M6ZNG4_9PROT|nr:dTMP kinase [Alkalicaulis satelles]KAA5804778.1 dTMP kinase [Alkalicaulis satelles]
MARGRFITLEGGEGAGKTTLARALRDALQAHGLEVVLTREPGGTPNAEALRELLLEGETGRWSPVAETLLLFAAREDHVRRLIEPALARGAWVICDRFSDSTRAYQGAAGGLEAARITAIEQAALGAMAPDLTVIADLDPEDGMARTRARGEAVTRFEAHPPQFHARLRQAFLDIAAAEPKRCVVLDASQTPDALARAALDAIETRLGLP